VTHLICPSCHSVVELKETDATDECVQFWGECTCEYHYTLLMRKKGEGEHGRTSGPDRQGS
jgi:hypothetical protein